MIDMTGVEPQHVCAECHGLEGAGNRIKFPRLAGQKAAYIVKQLQDFPRRAAQERRRPDAAIRQPELEESDIPRVAEWFSTQEAPWPKQTLEGELNLDGTPRQGRDHQQSAVEPGCLSCHSAAQPYCLPDRAIVAPRLAGQYDYYIAKQLMDYRDGRRGNRRGPHDAQDRAPADRRRHQEPGGFPVAKSRACTREAGGHELSRCQPRPPSLEAKLALFLAETTEGSEPGGELPVAAHARAVGDHAAARQPGRDRGGRHRVPEQGDQHTGIWLIEEGIVRTFYAAGIGAPVALASGPPDTSSAGRKSSAAASASGRRMWPRPAVCSTCRPAGPSAG